MTAVKLFDFQEEDRAKAVDAFLEQGYTRVLGVWPTGSGKAVLFSEFHLEPRMQVWMEQFLPTKRQILVLAHRDELISQAVDKIQRSNPDLVIGVEKAERHSQHLDDVVVASIQTLSASQGKRLRKLDPDRFRIVVVDEAHHAASPSYLLVLQHFGFLPPPDFMRETRPDKKKGRAALLAWQRERLRAWDELTPDKEDRLLLGLTATPKRGDKIGLECVFQTIGFERPIREMIERGRLCRLRAFRVKTDTSLDEVGTRAGDFEQEKLAETINKDRRNAMAVKAYLDYADGRKGMTFCANVAHAVAMAEAFKAAGISAEVVHGKLADAERKRILREFAAGNIKMLTNCNVLCLDSETEILTRSGWTKPADMTPLHRVANWDNGRVFFEEPKLIVRRPRFEGETMVSYFSARHQFRVTGKHRMLVKVGSRAEIRQAVDIVGKTVDVPVSGLAAPEPTFVADRAALDLSSRRITETDSVQYKQPYELTLDECRFIGFWIGDGSVSALQSGGLEYSASQSMVYPKNIAWFDDVISRMDLDTVRSEYPDRLNGVVKWSFGRGTGYGSQFRRGVFALEPYLQKDGTDLFWGLDEQQFWALLEGLDRADGLHESNRPSLYIGGTALRLFDLLQAIAACRGVETSLTRSADPAKPHHNQMHMFRARRGNGYITLGAGNVQIKQETGHQHETVWCVTSTSGNIITRRNGRVTVTGNTEGFDEPDVQVIIHARPTQSSLLYIQMTGRGLRVAPGKENCIVIDIVDITRKHSLITSPELLGLPVGFDAGGKDLLSLKEQVESVQAQFPLADLTDIKDIEDCQLRVAEVDLLGNFHDPVLDQHTKLAWEKTGEGYELSWRGQLLNEFAEVAPADNGQWAFRVKKGRKVDFEKTFETPNAALSHAEDWLYKNKPSVWSLNSKHTRDWNDPANEDQKRAVAAFGLKANINNLTKGEARLILGHHYAKARRYA